MEWQAHIIKSHWAPDSPIWLADTFTCWAPIGWLLTISSSALALLCPPQSSVGPSLRRNTKMGFLAKTLYFTLSVSNYRLAHARPGFLDSKNNQLLAFKICTLTSLGLQFLLPDLIQNSNLNLTLPTSAFGSDESIIAVPDPSFRKGYDI